MIKHSLSTCCLDPSVSNLFCCCFFDSEHPKLTNAFGSQAAVQFVFQCIVFSQWELLHLSAVDLFKWGQGLKISNGGPCERPALNPVARAVLCCAAFLPSSPQSFYGSLFEQNPGNIFSWPRTKHKLFCPHHNCAGCGGKGFIWRCEYFGVFDSAMKWSRLLLVLLDLKRKCALNG